MIKKKASQLFLAERLWVLVDDLVFGFIYSIFSIFNFNNFFIILILIQNYNIF